MKRLLLAAFAALSVAALSACGGSGHEPSVTGPGFVGFDDPVATVDTAPLLSVTFTVPPSAVPQTVNILSDRLSDGDIAFDPVSSVFTVTSPASEVFFGEDSFNPHRPEFRSFLSFPLDGVGATVPGTAVIVSAALEVFVTEVAFAPVVPTFLDLVEYPPRGLDTPDFSSAPLDFRTLDFLSSDVGNFVRIDVTPLMQTAQAQVPTLLDFQARFSLDTGAPLTPREPAKAASRTVHAPPRAIDGTLHRGSAAPLSPRRR